MVRVKRRYIVLKLVRDKNQESISEAELKNEIKSYVAKTYGDFGIGCLNRGFAVKRYNPNEGYVVIQMRKGVHEMVMSIVPLVTSMNGKSCGLSLIHLSGTLRSSFKKLQNHYITNLRAIIGQQLRKNSSKVKITNISNNKIS